MRKEKRQMSQILSNFEQGLGHLATSRPQAQACPSHFQGKVFKPTHLNSGHVGKWESGVLAMTKIEQAIQNIRDQADSARIDEFRARKRFRLWKIGKRPKEPEHACAWWNHNMAHVAQLIFENAKPVPVGLSTDWIGDEVYYTEGWILGLTWKNTAYQEYHDLLLKIRNESDVAVISEAWKKLQSISDVIEDYALPLDEKQREFYIRSATLYMHEYHKSRLIADNIRGILEFIRQFERLPKPEEASLEEE